MDEGWGDIGDMGDIGELEMSIGSLSSGFQPERLDDIGGRTNVPACPADQTTK
jgi:hypothetical protein